MIPLTKKTKSNWDSKSQSGIGKGVSRKFSTTNSEFNTSRQGSRIRNHVSQFNDDPHGGRPPRGKKPSLHMESLDYDEPEMDPNRQTTPMGLGDSEKPFSYIDDDPNNRSVLSHNKPSEPKNRRNKERRSNTKRKMRTN